MGKTAPSRANAAPTTQELIESFDEHAVSIARRQYFQPGDEDLAGMFGRVAAWVASAEPEATRDETTQRFFELMAGKRFCPGGRVLAGADTSHGNVLNCFVQDGSPEEVGTDAWVLRLATKLALVTKVGGGNGVCLDPIRGKRPFPGKAGKLYLTIAPSHPDYEKVRDGTFMDLVHGSYVTKGYRHARFVEYDDIPAGLLTREVGDSVEQIWKSAGDMILALLEGKDALLDLSRLRAEGTPVNGSGGTSSGPSSFAVEVFDNFAVWASLGGAEYAGPVATLRYVFAPTLRAIRQGGTRRGAGMATMSITHDDIEDFITAKDLAREEAEGDISTFNISVLVGDDFMQRSMQARARGDRGILSTIADHAWQTGEPGLIFIDRINEHNPMREAYGDIRSTNPCVTADTWVQTHIGPRQVAELVGVDFCASVDGTSYALRSHGFWKTGRKPVFRVRTRRGLELRLTGNHKLAKVVEQTRHGQEVEWTETAELAPGDSIRLTDHRNAGPWSGPGTRDEGWLLGLLVGDGTFYREEGRKDRACLDFWGEDRERMAGRAAAILRKLSPLTRVAISTSDTKIRLTSDALTELAHSYGIRAADKSPRAAVERSSHAFHSGFLQGLFDADGSVQGTQEKGVSVRLAQSDVATLRVAQRMLGRLGIASTLYQERRPEGISVLPDGRGGTAEYAVKAQHELVVANDNLAVYHQTVGFEASAKAERLAAALAAYVRDLNRERFVDQIASIEPDGEEDVYDVTVDTVHAFDANGILAHNCGEIPLYPGEPCDLGAMNLAAYVETPGAGLDGFDFATFREDVASCTRFLDNVLEVNRFALEDNRRMSMKLRRLGLGVMGLADALIKMGYAYDTPEGRAAVEAMIAALRDAATAASETLAVERGPFPESDKSDVADPRRNVAVLTVAPTGTTSMLMGVSSGVEPVFAPFIYRKIGDSYAALIHPLFQELLDEHEPHPEYRSGSGWDWEEVVAAVQENHGSVQGLDFIPDDVKAVLICAHDIAPRDHVQMQGVVQRTFDGGKKVANSISKTINMPNEASVQDVYDAYSLAFETGCKGITVYRDGSRQFQVLSTKADKKGESGEASATDAAPAASGAGAPAEPQPATHVSAPARSSKPQSDRGDRLPGEPLFDRPGRLEGFTDAVKLTLPTGEKRGFYVIVNKQDGLPSEVFILSGKAGDEANADSEALGRVVSIALQYGVPAEAIVKTLRGINGGMYGTYQGRMVASKADLLAVALESAGTQNVLNQGKGCPDCGAPLRFEEGCQKCESCGYSKCG